MMDGNTNGGVNKMLKFTDETLPSGWIRELKRRRRSIENERFRWGVYLYSPTGERLTSRKKLRKYIEKNGLPYDADDFDFNPYVSMSGTGFKVVKTQDQLFEGVMPSYKVDPLVSEFLVCLCAGS